jgi:nucleoside-diphosphate-sugar epimerase
VNALVTGVAGFIGSTLAGTLLEQGAGVTGIDCFTDYYPRAVKEANLAPLLSRPSFRFVESTIQSADLVGLLARATHVFHLAAQPGVRKSWGGDFQVYTRNNIEATQVLLEACVAAKVERVVYASSSSVYGDETALPMVETALPTPLSPYGVTKLAAEHLCNLYCANHGVPCVSLRYFTVYGPRQRPDMGFHRFIRAAITSQPITLYGDGRQTRDFTFVDDAAAATATAAVRGVPGRVYNIGGGSRISVNDALDIVGRLAGHELDIRREDKQKGDMRDTYADTARARADLGFSPTVSIQEGLAAEYEWLAGMLGRV